MIVYRITNLENGKRYIGITTRALRKRRMEHHAEATAGSKKPIHAAIRKYGRAGFGWEIIEEHDDEISLMAAEVRLISELKPEYNITRGGKGVTGLRHSEDARAKMSAAQTPELRTRFSAARKGVPRTSEAIAAMVASQTPERRARFSATRKGYKHRPDTVERLREIGLQNKDKWAKFASLGPQASSKPVICIDDGRRYPSASEAARAYGLDKSLVAAVCAGDPRRITAGGNRFIYEGAPLPERASKKSKLTAEQVEIIKVVRDYGATPRQIGQVYGVSHTTISDILAGRTWARVLRGGGGVPSK